MERAMGIEPTTTCLGSKSSTTELHPQIIKPIKNTYQYKTTNEVQASLPSFQRHLRAENLSRATLETYSWAVYSVRQLPGPEGNAW